MAGRSWKLLALSAAFVGVAFGVLFWMLATEQTRHQNQTLARELRAHARLIATTIRDNWPDIHRADTAQRFRILRDEGIDVAILQPDGDPVREPSLSTWTEALAESETFREALSATGVGETRGAWGPDGREHLMVAVRIGTQDEPLGVVWLARPTWSFVSDHSGITRQITAAVLLIAVLTMALAIILLRVRQRVFYRLVVAARKLAQGDVHGEVDGLVSDGEYAPLASALNVVRRRLLSQLETIDLQRRTLEAILNQLHEGVIVARADGRVALVNPAAARLLNLKLGPDGPAGLVGRPVETCIPQHVLQRQLLDPLGSEADARGNGAPDEALHRRRITIEGPRQTVHLLADASEVQLAEVRGDEAVPRGRVIVLTEVTELQRTIQMRTDFVANASHELRTPLSTIRAAVETLLTMDLAHEAGSATQFLNVINRHSRRLEEMVSDLLDLSRLESPNKSFEPQSLTPRGILDDLRMRFAEELERKQIRWEATCSPEDLRQIIVNPQLLRLALDNLVDNAIKFTPPEGRITVRLSAVAHDVTFEVSDTGCGIPEDEQQRVFERFYQVERGRSGPERGTGLGLSIVRHAAGALRGRAELSSTPGVGTTVRLTIPREAPQPVEGAASPV